MFNKFLYPIIYLIIIFTVASCSEKFDKTKWDDYDHLDGSDRSLMAKDLIQNHKLTGLSNKQMIQLLGSPENDTTETWYQLKEEYEFLGIDPVSSKSLLIKFNKDSIIISAKIKEWHKN